MTASERAAISLAVKLLEEQAGDLFHCESVNGKWTGDAEDRKHYRQLKTTAKQLRNMIRKGRSK